MKTKSIPTIEDIQTATRSLLEAYGFLGAVVFGSYAQGTASENSDVDIFVDVPNGTRTKSVFAFAYDLGEILGKDVDAYGSHEVPKSSDLYSQIKMNGLQIDQGYAQE